MSISDHINHVQEESAKNLAWPGARRAEVTIMKGEALRGGERGERREVKEDQVAPSREKSVGGTNNRARASADKDGRTWSS
jgi:hypothetical protein